MEFPGILNTLFARNVLKNLLSITATLGTLRAYGTRVFPQKHLCLVHTIR